MQVAVGRLQVTIAVANRDQRRHDRPVNQPDTLEQTYRRERRLQEVEAERAMYVTKIHQGRPGSRRGFDDAAVTGGLPDAHHWPRCTTR